LDVHRTAAVNATPPLPDAALPPRARPRVSVCIPAYNRARFLAPLLHSIVSQGDDLAEQVEIVICEDASPEREQIRTAAASFAAPAAWVLRYVENPHNLGYDGNIRRLVELAQGEFCFFMGNDDVMAPRALRVCLDYLKRYPNVGMVLRGYAIFQTDPQHPTSTIRYVQTPTLLKAGTDALALCFRRSGVISGYIVARDAAQAASTAQFDGGLYYQMHLTASVCATRPALVIPEVLVLCRDGTPPDFGAASTEQQHFVPGHYTPQARVHMVKSALEILDAHPALKTNGARDRVVRDYARHFYPFVMDQLGQPWRVYLKFCRDMARLPVGRYASFHVNCWLPYLLGRQRTDACIGWVRQRLGRTPRL
jgi:abequosyltransferase